MTGRTGPGLLWGSCIDPDEFFKDTSSCLLYLLNVFLSEPAAQTQEPEPGSVHWVRDMGEYCIFWFWFCCSRPRQYKVDPHCGAAVTSQDINIFTHGWFHDLQMRQMTHHIRQRFKKKSDLFTDISFLFLI